MSRDHHSTYRGSRIKVRSQESKATGSLVPVFTGSYMVTSEDDKQSPWRHFTEIPFATSDTAVAYALGQAHRFVDAQPTAHPQDGANGSKAG